LSTRAIETYNDSSTLRIVRSLDLLLLALALPVFLAAGFPLLGWGAASAGWLFQRGVQAFLSARARDSDDPRTVAGLLAGSMIGRGWLMALSVFAAGLVEKEAGLAAAVLVLALFTLYFSTNMLARPFGPPPRKRVAPSMPNGEAAG